LSAAESFADSLVADSFSSPSPLGEAAAAAAVEVGGGLEAELFAEDGFLPPLADFGLPPFADILAGFAAAADDVVLAGFAAADDDDVVFAGFANDVFADDDDDVDDVDILGGGLPLLFVDCVGMEKLFEGLG
jgi:hypothetical protein